MQGEVEKRTEVYEQYSEGDSQASTKQAASKISGMAGLASQQRNLTVVFLPLYHPAAALYNGGLREILIDDFKKIPIILTKIN